MMATGAEHYLEAEALLERGPGNYENPGDCWARAQVHATLAAAAATAYAAEGTGVLIRGYGDAPAAAPTPDVEVTDEPGVGAVVEAGGIRYFHQPTRLGDGNPWASAISVARGGIPAHWHAWAHITERGPVRLLLDAPEVGA